MKTTSHPKARLSTEAQESAVIRCTVPEVRLFDEVSNQGSATTGVDRATLGHGQIRFAKCDHVGGLFNNLEMELFEL